MAVNADEQEIMIGLVDDVPDMSHMDYDLEYSVRVGKTESRPLIDISRDNLDEQVFEEEFAPVRRRSRKPAEVAKMFIPPEPIRSALKPPTTCRGWLNFFLTRLPIIGWVIGYQPGYILHDIIAGITVAIMHIPQGLAYALLANLQPVYGLYASFMPVIAYSIFGTSRHLSVGTFAVVELMIGNAIDNALVSLNHEECITIDDDMAGGANNMTMVAMSDGLNMTQCDDLKVGMAITLSLLTGIIMVVMGICRLGFITIFLSEPLVSGYTTGAACHVFTSQLRHITGVEINRVSGPGSIPLTWINTFKMITEFNPAPIIIAALSIAALIVFKICNKLLQKPKAKVPFPVYKRKARHFTVKRIQWPIPIPSQLIVVIVATVVSSLAMLKVKYDVIVVGDIPSGIPPITVPNVSEYFLLLLQDAFVISIVTFSVTVSLAQVFARQHNYSVDSNQELMAYGIMNIVGCFFSSFPAAGSLSRSSVQANSGGKTQLVGFYSSLVLLVVLVKLGPLFYSLPRAVLAAIIWVALYGMFSQIKDVWKYFKLSLWDMLVWIVVFLATVFLGVDLGLGVGVGFSLLVIIVRTILPYSSTLGKAKDTEIFRNMDNFEKVKSIPGVIIFRFQAPLCFINSGVFRARLELDCNIGKNMGREERNGCIKELFLMIMRKTGKYKVSGEEAKVKAAYTSSNQAVTLSRSESFQQAVANDIVSVSSLPAGNNSGAAPINTVIIDCAPIGFMDAVGVKTLQQIVLDFDKVGIQVLFVAMTKENRDLLARSGFFQKCSKRWLFPSMQDAVAHAKHGLPLRPSQMHMSEPNGHIIGETNGHSNGENGLQPIEEEQEETSDQGIEVKVEVPGDGAVDSSHEVDHFNKKDS